MIKYWRENVNLNIRKIDLKSIGTWRKKSLWLFPGGEDHHHFIGKAAAGVLTDNFVTVKPLCYRKLFMIHRESIVPVYIAEKSKK